jgi:hypothetical protein
MSSAICTLFEGDYHYGVGALANSLYARGFRGVIYAGYRGWLPRWITAGGAVGEVTELKPAEGLTLRFVPLSTQVHLTNFKPDFMQMVWGNHCPDADALFYFDPDITIKCRWSFFEEWAEAGVALCEDVNSPMPSSHPIRHAWRQYYGAAGRPLENVLDVYVNGGFVGVTKTRQSFLEEWRQIQVEMAPAAGNLTGWGLQDRTFKFCFTDQDALNICLMATRLPYSLSGKDGMDLGRMGYLMSHALGAAKPWRRRYLWERVSRGFSVGAADKSYWANSAHPLAPHPRWRRLWGWLDMKGTIALDRIFRSA